MNNPEMITVILCTYNRAKYLQKALESVVAQVLPESVQWEILVVDNNSSDDTRQVVENSQCQHPERIRYLFEPQQGLAHARNAGIQYAHGSIVAFIDDDEIADQNWLRNLTANLFCGEWAGAGGRVLPRWDSPRPSWLSSNSSFLLGPLVMFDPDIKGGQLTEPPVGANMAFRREVFEKHGYFRTDLGRVGKSMLSGEDTEFGRRLMVSGKSLRYEPSAITYHPVEENRLNRQYFQAWWLHKGRSDAREFGIKSRVKSIFGIPLGLFRGIVIEAIRGMLTMNSSDRFICRLKVWTYIGQIIEHYQQWHSTRQDRLGHSTTLSRSEP
jgi:glycosyltransferase involved in cell wall biosynthesis